METMGGENKNRLVTIFNTIFYIDVKKLKKWEKLTNNLFKSEQKEKINVN